ncbi:hypothetical protein GDO86_003059 [Hymenochirus boettgeri]|uniref:Uncharacterized protein n=1 Tax=Hymenochirus boettgeri TaxID=247094 RepID=A0A8T2K2L6_9PIPI|nr:hypothetical protein GDO86_003059 [Hymenochirus boettgeri]
MNMLQHQWVSHFISGQFKTTIFFSYESCRINYIDTESIKMLTIWYKMLVTFIQKNGSHVRCRMNSNRDKGMEYAPGCPLQMPIAPTPHQNYFFTEVCCKQIKYLTK